MPSSTRGGPEQALIQSRTQMEQLLAELLAGDPRSRYRRDKCSDRLYFIELDGLHITAWFDEDPSITETSPLAEVLRVQEKRLQ